MERLTPEETALVGQLARLRDRLLDAIDEEQAVTDQLVRKLRVRGVLVGVAVLPCGNFTVLRDVDLHRSADSLSANGPPIETIYLQRIDDQSASL